MVVDLYFVCTLKSHTNATVVSIKKSEGGVAKFCQRVRKSTALGNHCYRTSRELYKSFDICLRLDGQRWHKVLSVAPLARTHAHSNVRRLRTQLCDGGRALILSSPDYGMPSPPPHCTHCFSWEWNGRVHALARTHGINPTLPLRARTYVLNLNNIIEIAKVSAMVLKKRN